MAANYWVSTQRRHWMFTRERLAEVRESLRERDKDGHQVQLPDMRIINIYFKDQICRLAKRMNSRQQAVATAQVYMKRFYTKVDFRHTNPYLVMVTAFYLACKMEECPQHIRFITGEARQFWPEFIANDPAKIGECEFYLISEMSSQLIVHHPYRTVSELSAELELSTEEVNQASNLISDHYQTDLPLLYPPHIIAVMAVLLAVLFGGGQRGTHGSMPHSMAASLREGGMGATMSALGADRHGARPDPRIQKIINWLAESDVDIRAIVECTQEMVSLYELMEGFNIQHVKEVITRMMKTKNIDK
ncbi:putative C-type cyclin [Talaromyces proteolyticus]|uniref:RNA polymerase II holoenzyme cyclin-like subunit n=1 Tax=Talaromyces proteolyticus TaxID=1131652 RepID=A0AAD4KPP2_9EURO|nr:putative C-type cyclin [Talaromyces proteolyticus]KAH8696445.1 putative C-type cyclin [Talaromyces proteolyticus]